MKKTLYTILSEKYSDLPRSIIKKIILEKLVKFGDMNLRPKTIIEDFERLEFEEVKIKELILKSNFHKITPVEGKVEIVYEDEDIIAINKQAGIAVHPSYKNFDNTLLNFLIYHILYKTDNPTTKVRPINRIDKETSGLVLFSKNLEAHEFYARQFKKREVMKEYSAVVSGDFSELIKPNNRLKVVNKIRKSPKGFVMSEDNLGEEAITEFEFLEFKKESNSSLIKAYPKTGRTHQIRVHLQGLGFPIVGDKPYGGRENERMLLHCERMVLKGRDAGELGLEAEVPGYFKS